MSKRKLLLADDSITIQKVVNLTFADEGIEVITVGDGDSALEKISEVEPDIVLFDIHMPGLNGYQLCQIIRENESTKDLPVILLVGLFEPFDEEEANRVGASAFLTKPFQSIRELVAQVTSLLAISEVPAEIPETEDIESLYRESFAETIEIPEGEQSASNFTDDGFDDEMIETSYANSDSEDSDELDDFGIAFPPETPVESEKESTIEFEPVPLDEVPGDVASVAQYSSPFDAPAYDDLPTEQPVESEPETEIESERAEPETEADSEAEGEKTHEPGIFDEPEESISELAAAETVSFNRITHELSQSAYLFEDLDLLELPDIGDDKTIELATPAGTEAAGGNKQVVSISPELMEIIVQKVVEKLAEKY